MKNTMRGLSLFMLFLVLLCTLGSCATYYQRTANMQMKYIQGDIDGALHQLEKTKLLKKERNRFLYFVNQGALLSMKGDYVNSNVAFENAYALIEDESKKTGNDVLGAFVNPMQTDYRGEPHEVIYIHYYKAINFLSLGQLEEALVEVRRMDNKLKRLSTEYKSDQKFKEDAFIHTLMGIVYEASGDDNNAFIAYRNAYNIYEGSYKKLFGVSTPQQLKLDLIRSAYASGFPDDGARYEKLFNLKNIAQKKSEGTLIYLWHNGLGPVKDETSINFTKIGDARNITLADSESGFSFSFPFPDNSNDANALNNLNFLRVALPKYIERVPVYRNATLYIGDVAKPLELVEDVNQIAFQALRDRLLTELGKAALRLAIKKGAEIALREASLAQARAAEGKTGKAKNNAEATSAALAGASVAMMLFNTFSEKADTRNWTTLPHSIYYTRVSLAPNIYNLEVQLNGAGSSTVKETVEIKANTTTFRRLFTGASQSLGPMFNR